MNTNSSKPGAISVIIISLATILIANNCSPKVSTLESYPKPGNKDASKVCKTITVSDMQKAFSKSKSEKLFLNIYPQKASNDPQKKDITLAVTFQDVTTNIINLDGKTNHKKFINKSYNYIRLLKENNVSKNIIPYGYYMEIDKLNVKQDLQLCLNIESFKLDFDPVFEVRSLRDTCQCPPMCPCPPEWLLMQGKSVKNIIEKVFSQQ